MIPTFPCDATILSIHLACLRVGRCYSLQSSSNDFYGAKVNLDNQFGYRANEFVERALDGTVPPEALIERHSMFPFISGFLTSDVTKRWCAALVSGHPDAYRRFNSVTRDGIRRSQGLRQCTACVLEDKAKYGTGHWHVMHQIPAVHTCDVHNQVLHDKCAGCGANFGVESGWGLPGEPCIRCGHSQTKPMPFAPESQGYRALAATISRAIQGQAPELRPEIRTCLLRRHIFKTNSDPTELLFRFLDYWNVLNLRDLEAILQCRIGIRGAFKLFRDGCATISISFLTAVIAYAWEQTIESDRQDILENGKIEPRILVGTVNVEPRSEDNLHAEIEVIARRFHLPDNVADHLAEGNRLLATELVGGLNVFLILEGLSQKAREQFVDRVRQYRQGSADRKSKVNKREPSNLEEKICKMRGEIQKVIANGCTSRSQLKGINATLYQNALRLDRQWLSSFLPSQHRILKTAGLTEKRDHYRALILTAIGSGKTSRMELRQVCSHACDFASRFDRKWFEVIAPRSSVRRGTATPVKPRK